MPESGYNTVDLISEAKKYKHELKDLILHATGKIPFVFVCGKV